MSGDEDLMRYFFEAKSDGLDYACNLKRKVESVTIALAMGLWTDAHQ